MKGEKMQSKLGVFLLFLVLFSTGLHADIFQDKILAQFDNAFVRTKGNILHVETGHVARDWKWTGHGLVTVDFKNQKTGTRWTQPNPQFNSDWNFPGFIEDNTTCELVSLSAGPVRFSPWTGDHVRVVAEMVYPAAKLQIKYEIWVYPNSPGVRTQVSVKGMPGFSAADAGSSNTARVDYLPVQVKELDRRIAGYYNHTQRRNKEETEILREDVKTQPIQGTEEYDWASVVWLENETEGLALVKESHKCVNQQGINTGIFTCGPAGLVSTGWGLTATDILTERYRPAWASWGLVFHGGADGRELALKIFDRDRYPVDPARDIYILANTWGSTDDKSTAQSRAAQENVIREIKSQADLGIDVQQIDDGWQGNDYDSWQPIKARYPDGWKTVRHVAREHGVTLGLWAAGERIPLQDLKYNFDGGGFKYYKLDFVNLQSYDELEELVTKVHKFAEYTHHLVRVNWDVTENPPRMGYYYGREYGNIYLENRKPVKPEHVVYVPHLVLRDAWQLSKYVNLNKFQITVQNIDRVNRSVSDAFQHNHPYCVAITLMGSPIFFQETQYYDKNDREQIRPLLALYKQHRDDMYKGYVYPVGEKPDNASWAGFQNHNQTNGEGYITLFRELENKNPVRKIQLRFLAGKRIELMDLRKKTTKTGMVDKNGFVEFTIKRTPDFKFLKYKVLKGDALNINEQQR